MNTYKKTYLQDVIAKIDFIEPVEELSQIILPENLKNMLKSSYQIYESQIQTTNQILLNQNGFSNNSQKVHQHIFHNLNRTQSILIDKNQIIITFKKYDNFESFKSNVLIPLKEISQINKQIVIARTGLRYINVFNHFNANNTEITNSYHKMVSGSFLDIIDNNNLARNITIIEYLFDDLKLRIQSGIFNNEFPSIIKNKDFLLDFDCYIDTPHLFNDLEKTFDNLHGIIKNKFEFIITDLIREKLNG